jgi:hypothetical protein
MNNNLTNEINLNYLNQSMINTYALSLSGYIDNLYLMNNNLTNNINNNFSTLSSLINNIPIGNKTINLTVNPAFYIPAYDYLNNSSGVTIINELFNGDGQITQADLIAIKGLSTLYGGVNNLKYGAAYHELVDLRYYVDNLHAYIDAVSNKISGSSSSSKKSSSSNFLGTLFNGIATAVTGATSAYAFYAIFMSLAAIETQLIFINFSIASIKVFLEALQLELKLLAQKTIFLNTVEFNNCLNVAGAIVCNSFVECVGGLNVAGKINMLGDVDIEGDTSIVGLTNIKGSVGIQGTVSIYGPLNIRGNISMFGYLDTETITVHNLKISQSCEILGGLVCGSTVKIAKEVTILGQTKIENKTYLNGLVNYHRTQLLDTLIIGDQNRVYPQALIVNGDSYFQGDVKFFQNIIICGNLYVQGDIIYGGRLINTQLDPNMYA